MMNRTPALILGLLVLSGAALAVAHDGRIYSDVSTSAQSYGMSHNQAHNGDCCDDNVHQSGHHHHNPQNGPAMYNRSANANGDHRAFDSRPTSKSLVRAVESGDVGEATLLLNQGVSPNVSNSEGTGSLLHEAVMNDDVELVRVLLERGANPNTLDNSGNTPLHHAVKHDRVASVEYLLQHGAKPNMVDGQKHGALYYARKNNQAATSRMLQQYGAK